MTDVRSLALALPEALICPSRKFSWFSKVMAELSRLFASLVNFATSSWMEADPLPDVDGIVVSLISELKPWLIERSLEIHAPPPAARAFEHHPSVLEE